MLQLKNDRFTVSAFGENLAESQGIEPISPGESTPPPISPDAFRSQSLLRCKTILSDYDLDLILVGSAQISDSETVGRCLTATV